MKEKYLTILEIIIIFALMIGAIFFKFLPEYKESKGSSDTYIDTESYQDIIELTVNNKTNFALVITDNTITNIIFLNQQSTCLYNQNIENTTITEGTKEIVELLIENNYLKQLSTINLTTYKNKSLSSVKTALEQAINNLGLEITIATSEKTITQKASELNVSGNDEEELLKQIELYSKDIVRKVTNDVSQSTTQNTKTEQLDETLSREYTDNVYKKIEVYMRTNNITNQEITNMTLAITLIPANKEGTIFPDDTSWYYIQDGKVYAYISITENNQNYSYCYQASIDEYKKGQC